MTKPTKPRPVIRLNQLPQYLGCKRTQIDVLVKNKVLNPFAMSPGGRNQVVFEDEVAQVQANAAEAARKAKETVERAATGRKVKE
jgi:hypothetical protein